MFRSRPLEVTGGLLRGVPPAELVTVCSIRTGIPVRGERAERGGRSDYPGSQVQVQQFETPGWGTLAGQIWLCQCPLNVRRISQNILEGHRHIALRAFSGGADAREAHEGRDGDPGPLPDHRVHRGVEVRRRARSGHEGVGVQIPGGADGKDVRTRVGGIYWP